MKVLSLVSQKGGVGKTTLATALAVVAHRGGKRPVLIDLDPQASASFWMDTRQDDSLAVSTIPSSRLGHVLKAAAKAGAELAIVDTPPFAKDIAYDAVVHGSASWLVTGRWVS
jgi:chromosome partitioning protein